VQDILTAFAKAYELTLEPGRASVLEHGDNYAIARLEDVYHFVDSHHVGAFEGAMKRAGVKGRVTIALRPPAADFLLEW